MAFADSCFFCTFANMKPQQYFIKLACIASILALGLGIFGCANRGAGPQGGPKDMLPPVVVGCTPQNGATLVTQNVFVIEFDELVNVDNVAQNVTISPPQQVMPSIKSTGKKIRIVFEDSLKANTTYTIEFNKAIVDNNEKNPLNSFTYVFSTGDHIDSLEIGGKVIDAATLVAMKELTVGIYSDHSDSAFLKKPFDRIAKTNEKGEFTVKNVSPGSYRVYALKDLTNTNFYLPTGPDIAFLDSIVIPEMHLHGTTDTLWKTPEKLAYDSVIVNAFPETYPKNLLLKSFIEVPECRQLLKKPIRHHAKLFQLSFACPIDTLPSIQLLNDSLASNNWYRMEPIVRRDSLLYWITDSTLYKKDTLEIAINYLRADSALQLIPARDTLKLVEAYNKNKKKAATTTLLNTPLTFTHNVSNKLEVYDTLQLAFNEPVEQFYKDSIGLFMVKDTLEIPIPFQVLLDDSICAVKAYLPFKKEFGKKYQLRVDSAAFVSIYGNANLHFNKPIDVKRLEDYSNLYIKFPVVPEHAIVELLDSKEQVVKRSRIVKREAAFEDLSPNRYALRMIIDANNNDKWDTGVLLEHKQPEEVYYFPKTLNLRANWDVEETWDITATPIEAQRPKDLASTKNKKR